MALTKSDLDQLSTHGCSNPECTEDHSILFLHAGCHIDGHLDISYRLGSGILRIACRECGKLVAMVRVADDRVDSHSLGQRYGDGLRPQR